MPTIRSGHALDFEESGSGHPPLDTMDQVTGYENVTFESASVPPDGWGSAETITSSEGRPGGVPAAELSEPKLTELEARKALASYVDQHCCYGRRAVNHMTLTKMTSSSAYHYELQTFTERRECCWTFVPFGGSSSAGVDGPEEGPAPLPWDMDLSPSNAFQDEMKTLAVPNTASVKQCYRCRGGGTIHCSDCHGKGWVRCLSCHGDGFGADSGPGPGGYKERCFHCRSSAHGSGRQDCTKCNAKGKMVCGACDSTGLLLCFIQLTVTWKVNTSEHIVERMALPLELLSAVSGKVVFEEEALHVLPLSDFPDENINVASGTLIESHSQRFQDQRMLAQRQQVREIPVTAVTYDWDGKRQEFFVYGFEQRVFAPKYPQSCCCGCTLL